ncbi:Phosphoglycolate phosphatase [Thalassovita gelatinovora]|uniref:Phosphoglycolate phosphatase n=1 Tax=Thalassovita gelatinovora TaxID=53501 RepID=A0A0P1F8J1_THAGE|nr:phosphoglycolate phosphatase [Thalassovita gelatinovora]QIZ80399.1 phosphoglycolate phosphatase [Thalassovita gelatinovora]CUH64382.1 Phosphoglycolate phosphatase [Thalassovita gelatinovora]SEQ92471.1 phosphoglycolate phosphatase [Thalassovita gelatinovora]
MARIVFDLDGTLIDSAPDIRSIANTILFESGLEPITLEETISFIGNGASVFVEKMRAARGVPEDDHARLLQAFQDRYDSYFELTAPFPNVREALAHLRVAGHRLGLCTNKPMHATRAVLSHLALSDPWDVVYGGDSLDRRKPDPAPLLAAFAEMGNGPCLYIGDSEVDAETAERAEVPFLLYTEGYRKTPVDQLTHRAVFSDFAELPELVQSQLAVQA